MPFIETFTTRTSLSTTAKPIRMFHFGNWLVVLDIIWGSTPWWSKIYESKATNEGTKLHRGDGSVGFTHGLSDCWLLM